MEKYKANTCTAKANILDGLKRRLTRHLDENGRGKLNEKEKPKIGEERHDGGLKSMCERKE